ncbi:MAG TPA: hypothetical protein VGF53_12395 [Pseudolabrys sp.]|jgi:hypothetical protein
MKKTIFALAAAATIALGTMAAPQPAQARCFGCAVGLGVLGGVIIGSAIASQPGYYAYEYDGPAPVACDGYWARKRLYDGAGNFVGWGRPRWFCR